MRSFFVALLSLAPGISSFPTPCLATCYDISADFTKSFTFHSSTSKYINKVKVWGRVDSSCNIVRGVHGFTRFAIKNSDDSAGGATVLDQPVVAEKEKVEAPEKEKKRLGAGGWEVRLYNDPMNKREFVARCLSEITGMSDSAAYDTMMQAHQNGLAVIGRYVFEMAELYHDRLRDHGLFVDMIPVDEDK